MDVTIRSGSLSRASGLTLIELVIGLSIAVTVSVLSIPMGKLLRSNQNVSNMHEFLTTLNLARTEAIKYNIPVTICRTLTGNRCGAPDDIKGRKVWENGWMVFFDYNANGVFNRKTDKIFYVHDKIKNDYAIRSNAKVRITYKGTGIAPGFMDTWTFCDPTKDVTIARGVVLAYTGRARLARDTNNNGTRDNGTGHSRSRPRELYCD